MRPIAVIGNVVLDVTVEVHLPSLPVGRQTPAPIGLQAGGGLPNVGRLLRAMGREVIPVGAVGADPAGAVVQRLLPWRLVEVPEATTEISVIATRGERTIVNSQGTATVPAARLVSLLEPAGVAVFAYLNCCSLAPDDVPAAVAAAKRAGRTVVGGLNGVFSDERRRVVSDVLDQLDLLVLNAAEAAWLSGEPAAEAAALALGVRAPRVCVTLGAAGLLLVEGRRPRRWTAKPIEGGRSLGAGDAFLAGVVAALDDDGGWEAALERGLSAAEAWVAGRPV